VLPITPAAQTKTIVVIDRAGVGVLAQELKRPDQARVIGIARGFAVHSGAIGRSSNRSASAATLISSCFTGLAKCRADFLGRALAWTGSKSSFQFALEERLCGLGVAVRLRWVFLEAKLRFSGK
jgi:hypothetical protein